MDKELGNVFSTNDYTTTEQTKVENLSGTDTGDNATNTQYRGLVTNAIDTGDATGGTALTLATVNQIALRLSGCIHNQTSNPFRIIWRGFSFLPQPSK